MSTAEGSLPLRAPSGRIQLQEYALVGVVVAILIAGAILEPDAFLTSDNMLNVLRQASVVGVLAIGMTFVIATGGIDLSVGSMVAAAAVAGGQLVDSGSLAFMLGALGMGILLGGINAGAIAYGKVVPFIATLAMFTMARGLALWLSDKTPVSLFSLETVRWFGNGEVLGIPSAVIVFLAVTALAWVLLNRTRYGRYVVAVGGNEAAARLAGIHVHRTKITVYALSGLLAGLAGLIETARLGASDAAATADAIAITEPTERSMPPVAITKVIPTATSTVGETCRRMLRKLFTSKKFGVKSELATKSRTSAASAP